MSPWLPLFQAALVLAGGLSALLASYTWQNRERIGALPLCATMVGGLVWIGALLVATVTRGSPVALAANRFVVPGSNLVVAGFFVFVLEYTNREEWVRRRYLLALSVVPVAATVVAFTNPLHGLFFDVGGLDVARPTGFLIEPAPGFVANTIYNYALLAAGTVMLLGFAVDAAATYRYQTGAILVATGVPWIGHVLRTAGLVPAGVTPIAFAVTGGALVWAVFRAQLLDLVPVGRHRVIDDLSAGVFTVDNQGRLVDINPMGRRFFRLDPDERVVGKHVEEVLADYPTVRNYYVAVADLGEEVQFEAGLDGRYYEIEAFPLNDARDRHVGQTIIVRDVTDRIEREQELERQNERLERFASVVSHDLRNPLSVISGRAEVAREADDVDPHLDAIVESADRMGEIIDDVLALTRGDDDLTREPVAVDDLAREAWDHIDSGDAALSVTTDETIRADRSQLLQAFENLFRNSIEHGPTGNRPEPTDADRCGSDLTVQVGAFTDGEATGIFVADTGDGIPTDDHERVLEDGFSTSGDGTGLGLSVVTDIAAGHGWDVRVTDSESGGARIELVTDEQPADPVRPTSAE
ncbi:histidine kinase N-terminal 7TM domain-containing protein [Halorientalis regularis]|jgi:PAS domain S-box-containing protein|uniref:histidine kinase n=1 Tax=Halorientalis regularis TaxID=660518 RepID=A0A1G7SBI7_9EURY|nr:histidine kinase N-terminal 7TM domain-containing protein [Halorientalis regularis]SDG20353.1 PAS domain S-box-containing protein [Halorientalis regularis]